MTLCTGRRLRELQNQRLRLDLKHELYNSAAAFPPATGAGCSRTLFSPANVLCTCTLRLSLRLPTALAFAAAQRGNHFAETSTRARQTIAELGARFIRNGMRVLAHGHSRVVLALLRLAVKQGVQFDVVVTEGRVGANAHLPRARHGQPGLLPPTLVFPVAPCVSPLTWFKNSSASYVVSGIATILVWLHTVEREQMYMP